MSDRTENKTETREIADDADCPRRARLFLHGMATQGAALLWRRNAWHMLPSRGGPAIAISRYRNRMIHDLVGRGLLVESPDGLLRPKRSPIAPVVDTDETPLRRLMTARRDDGTAFFDAEQLRAAEKLRSDFEGARLSQRVVASYAPAEGRSSRHWQVSDNAVENLSDATLAARQRLHRAMAAVGPELSSILFQVCCLIAGLEEAERHLALPKRAGKAVLGLALTRLARHYGLKPDLRHEGPSRIGHWRSSELPSSLTPEEPPERRP